LVRRTPRAVRIVCLAALVLAAFSPTNLVYHVVRKPSELLFFVGGALDKEPIETWRRYEPLFHTYSTPSITPELLAALAQVESTGNPVARAYWRRQLTWNPFAMYKPASSAVGMYQMTDAAYAEAARYCIPRSATAAIRYDDAVLDAPALAKRGERIHVQWTATMLLDGERNVIGLSVVMQEVTRSKENG
jgi:hypothetical protein